MAVADVCRNNVVIINHVRRYHTYEVVEIFSLKLSKMKLSKKGVWKRVSHMLCDSRASAKWSPHC